MLDKAELKSKNLFIQANATQTNLSLQKIGEIISMICKDSPNAQANIPTINNIPTLNIVNPFEGINSININRVRIFADLNAQHHNIENIIEYFAGKIIEISNMLNVTQYDRLGERRQYVHIFDTESEKITFFKSFVKFDNFEEVAISRLIKCDEFKAQTQIMPSKNTDNKGVLIDIDIYYDNIMALDSIKRYVTEINTAFIKVLGKILD